MSTDGGNELANEAKTWASFCHWLGFAFFVVPLVGNIAGPLAVWLLKRHQYEFVDDQGKEALNFQITVTIAAIIAAVLMCIFIGMILLPLVVIFDVISIVVAAVKASNGERYRYPYTLRLVK